MTTIDYGESYRITFRVERIIKEYEDDYFKIASVRISKQTPTNPSNHLPLGEREVLLLNTPSLIEGNTYQTTARTIKHDTYGMNLKAVSKVSIVVPENEEEYRRFLQKNFTGIGRTYAKKLIDLFGLDVIDNILHNDRALRLVGIPTAKEDFIRDTAFKMIALNRLIGFLQEFNVPIPVAQKVYDKLGRSAREQLKVNPWLLTTVEYHYLGYADAIAQGLGFEAHHPERVRSGILAYIKNRMNAGHMAIYEEELHSGELVDWMNQYGDYSADENDAITPTLIDKEMATLKEDWVLETPVNAVGRRMVYFRSTLKVEERIVSGLKTLLLGGRLPIANRAEVPSFLSALETGAHLSAEDKKAGKKPFTPAEEQRAAIQMALTTPFSVLTGGPGTGKTTVVNAIVQGIEYIRPGSTIAMLAPTGKAAKRMAEITQREAMTIHRKLNMQQDMEDDDQLNEIEEDFVIVDESSMMDAFLFSTLINNVSDKTSILLVGDVNQLPSVGSGAILRDLIDSEVVPTTRLLKVFRQAESSPIVSNAYKLNRGESVDDMAFVNGSQMMMKELEHDHHVQDAIVRYVQRVSAKRSLTDIAVLTPMRKGLLGVHELNRRIQDTMNPRNTKKKQEIALNKRLDLYLREGDRVMQVVNDNDKGIANGETGTVELIYDDVTESESGIKSVTTCVDIIVEEGKPEERTITYTAREAREQLELAYAMTIHKSQGSEYGTVIIPFVEQHQFMLKRNLVYTAWTRAKELVINVGQKEWIEYASKHNENVIRISQIKEKVRREIRSELALAS